MRRATIILAGLLGLASAPANAELDLANAGVTRLENGLTVIVLEDHTLPVVSVQVLYKSGSRDETAGKTGLAHFLEHLAFRSSANFPDGAANAAVYDAGGEWHGYTWIDQTTYFATAPSGELDLLLKIEADRMARITIDPEAISAEKGAVITELRGYQNDPTSVMFDAVAAAALQVHPYRNNTIGYESDVAALTLEDAKAFYARHYAPANAVLAVVGDIEAAEALALVRKQFGILPSREAPARVAAVEPPQSGERRLVVTGPVDRHYLRLAFPAPAASSQDFAAFLLMQQLLSGGSGVNFRQNDWGTPSVDGSKLFGAAEDMASWFIPTGDPYLFMLSASTKGDITALEDEIEHRIEAFRAAKPDVAALERARAGIRRQLAFDLETPEDAAHQLAFFEGLGALPALLGLDAALDTVSPEDVQRIAFAYLDPARRTVGWYLAGETSQPLKSSEAQSQRASGRPARAEDRLSAEEPKIYHLSNGLPVIVRSASLSPTATVKLLRSGTGFAQGYGAITASGIASEIQDLVEQVAKQAAEDDGKDDPERSNDPATRLDQMLADQRAKAGQPEPILAVVSGAINTAATLAALEAKLSNLPVGRAPERKQFVPIAKPIETRAERIPLPLAQAALGYSIAAPSPGSREGVAWRMLLYVLTHEYGGRLGKSAISDSGLVYYIGSDYSGDQAGGRIEITTGVNPDKLDAMEALLRSEIHALAANLPTQAELAAARTHILGRERSAAMDNGEIADHLARSWLADGSLPDLAALEKLLASIGPDEIASAARSFGSGIILRVDVGVKP